MKRADHSSTIQVSPANFPSLSVGEPSPPGARTLASGCGGSGQQVLRTSVPGNGGTGPASAKRVLIVDDEAAILFGFKKIIQCGGIEVDTAETIEDALELLRCKEYQFVITDLKLSGSSADSGFDVIRFAKERRPETNVILITGYGTPEVMEKAFSLGAAHYYEKPVSGTMLRDALVRMGM